MRRVFIGNPWPSTDIRGHQIADRLENAVVDPGNVFPDDIYIFIKSYPEAELIDYLGKCYVDVVDNIPAAKNCSPDVGVIAIGKTAHGYISKLLDRDDVLLIPEHHCNFDREVRESRDVLRVGYCGIEDCFHLNVKDVTEALANIGMEFVCNFKVKDRMCVVDFYMSIDIHLTFREDAKMSAPSLKNPLKLANAGSFNIPTVGFPEQNYIDEWDGCFAKVRSLDEVVRAVKVLKESEAAYENLAGLGFEKAKEYHIDKIIPLYEELVV